MFDDLLISSQKKFENRTLRDRVYLQIPTPNWAKDDQLEGFFENQSHVLNGRLTWGWLIQADEDLSEAGESDGLGEVVFCSKPGISAQVETLKAVAETLRGYQTTFPDHPNLKAVAALVNDPAIRKFGTPIPAKLTNSHPCAISTIYIPRKHLPEGKLSDPLFPILVSENPQMAMILPERFWPEAFREQWCKSEGF